MRTKVKKQKMKTSLGDKISTRFSVGHPGNFDLLVLCDIVSDLVCTLCVTDIQYLSGISSGNYALAT